MFNRKIISTTAFPLLLLFAGVALAQEAPSECVEQGALAYGPTRTLGSGIDCPTPTAN